MLFAGIDGGQSGTEAVIADGSGRILARGAAGPADEVAQAPGSTRLHDALAGALAGALAHAGLPAGSRFEAVAAGISGYEGRVYGAPPALPAAHLELLHDTQIAHAGALAGEPGVVVIAGTGSVGYAVNADGGSALAGGWGYLFGDEGSAFALAREALAAAMREADEGREGALLSAASAHFGTASLREIARGFYTGRVTRARVAAFAEPILELAARGDAQAKQHAASAAWALAALAGRTMRLAGMQTARVAFTGGMMRAPGFRECVLRELLTLAPGAQPAEPRYDPAAGALLLAYKAAGIAPPTLRE